MNTRFSIITITKNDRTGFEKTMRSVQAQTCRDFEWIVIDGGSTDGTRDLIRENAKDITKWCTGKDTGLYNAMNIGTDMATGDYLIYMNGGDIFADADTLSAVAEAAKNNNNPDIIYGDCFRSEESSTIKTYSHSLYEPSLQSLPTVHQSIYFKRTSVGTARYNEKYKIAADYGLYIDIVNKKGSRTHRMNRPLSTYDSGGISSQKIGRSILEYYCIQKKHLTEAFPAAEKRFLKNYVAGEIMRKAPKLHRFICDAYHIVKPRKQVIIPSNVIKAEI